jgi:hypothetical protein
MNRYSAENSRDARIRIRGFVEGVVGGVVEIIIERGIEEVVGGAEEGVKGVEGVSDALVL